MEKTEFYDELNEELYKFIFLDDEDEEYLSIEQLVLAEKFCDILLYNFDFDMFCDDPKFLKKISKGSSVDYSKKFLEFLKPEYAEKLLKNIEKGVFSFCEIEEQEFGYASYIGGKKVISVPLRNDLSDTFIITHEEIHDTTFDSNEMSVSWSYFSELPTMLSELLQADYMEEMGIDSKEIRKYKKFSTSGYIYRALMLKVQINLLKQILTIGYIDCTYMSELLKELYEICYDEGLAYDAIDDSISKLFLEEKEDELYESFYFFDLRYVIGGVLSTYLHDKILEDKKLIKYFAEYNENFGSSDIQGVFESFGLDFEEKNCLDLSEKSYKNLEKSFVKELKRIW